MLNYKHLKARENPCFFDYAWEQRKLGEALDFSIKINSLSRDKLSYEKRKIKNIHYGDILVKFDSVLDYTNSQIPYIAEESEKIKSDMFLRNGDIIFADAAEDYSVGKCIELQNIQGDIVAGLHTIVGRPKFSFSPCFLGHYLNSQGFRSNLLPLIQGIKVSSISKNNLMTTDIIFPTLSEQSAIGNFFQTLDRSIALHQRE